MVVPSLNSKLSPRSIRVYSPVCLFLTINPGEEGLPVILYYVPCISIVLLPRLSKETDFLTGALANFLFILS